MAENSNLVALCLAPQPVNLHFDSVNLVRDCLMTMHVAVGQSWAVLNRADDFGGAAPALRVVRELFAGLAYRVDQLAGLDPEIAEASD